MKKLFLCSFFSDTSSLLSTFAGPDLAGKTVTFIPTAGNVEKVTFYIESARKIFRKLGIKIDELDIAQATPQEISEKLRGNDFIYVSGGNTFYLLQEMKRSGADKIINECVDAGRLYIGESAGSVITSPNIQYVDMMDPVGKAPLLDNFDALNLVDFYTLPHYASFPFKKACEKVIAKYGDSLALRPITNKQAMTVEGDVVTLVE
ncbi:MAG: type 1 glutamine amidotransferase-like domain-containing protein [Clostridiaceae bacterium]|nr:type 1 glutamine amidotransferase-like domain-containing protein [Clostridiaceae bacterium]